MRTLPIGIVALGIAVALQAIPDLGSDRLGVDPPVVSASVSEPTSAATAGSSPAGLATDELTAVVRRYCVVCHNDQLRTGNLSLQAFDVAEAVSHAPTAEKMIKKLRLDMMPPPGRRGRSATRSRSWQRRWRTKSTERGSVHPDQVRAGSSA